MLTITIPTYNRNEKLVRSIDRLIPQLSEQVNILILDNCSPVPVAESLGNRLSSKVRVVRNKHNVGMAANIIRCFEQCDSDWMWLLGDDEVPSGDAIAGVLEDIINNSSSSYLNYKSPLCDTRNSSFSAIGQDGLISKIDNFGNLLFISVGVYNLKKLPGDYRLAYQLAYSIAPHLVFLLSGLGREGISTFLVREIFDFHLRDTTDEEGWSWLSLSLCIPILYETPIVVSDKTKLKFAKHIRTHIKEPKSVFDILEQPKYDMIPTHHKQFLLRQIYFRSLLYTGFSLHFVNYLFCQLKFVFRNIFSKNKEVLSESVVDDRI